MERELRLVGVVPARGGSIGVPRKHLKPLAGYPLLAWTLVPACEACDLVVVSSDDAEILDAAKGHRVTRLKRSPLLATDRMPDLPVIQDALRYIDNEPGDLVLLLRPTAPFRRADEIRAVANLLVAAHADSVRSVVPAANHPQKCYLGTGYINLPPTYPPNAGVIHRDLPTGQFPYLAPATARHRANHPRQWLQPAYRACGFIDAVRADVVLGMDSMEGDLIVGWEAPIGRASIEMDSEGDFLWATVIAQEQSWRPGEIKE